MTPETLHRLFDVVADAPGGVQRLRELILQLAVRGKLVPQDPKDEPAADHLDSGSPSLPSTWTVSQLGAETTITRGITFPASAKGKVAEPGTVACLRTANVQDEIDWDDLIYVSEEYVKRDEQWIRPGDLIISMANSLELVGKVALVRDVPEKATVGGFLSIIRPSARLDANFLFVLLRSPVLLHEIRSTASRTTNIANLSLKGLQPIEIPLPPLPEQRRIVAKVDQLMSLCDELEERQRRRAEKRVSLNRSALHHLATATDDVDLARHWRRIRDHFDVLYEVPETVAELRQAILQLAVRGKLVPQDPNDEPASVLLERIEEEKRRLYAAGKIRKPKKLPPVEADEVPFEVPEGWEWVRLGMLGALIRGVSYSKSDAADVPSPDRAPILRAHNINGVLNFENLVYVLKEKIKPEQYVKAGDLLIAMSSGSKNLVGKAAQANTDYPGAFGAFCGAYRPYVHALDAYLRWYCQTDLYRSGVARASQGIGINNLRTSDVLEALIPVPPLSEQRRIVEKVEQLMALCDELEERLSNSRALAESIAAAVVNKLTAT